MNSLGLIAKRFCVAVWIAIPVTCLAIYIYDPRSFTAESIAAFLKHFENEILFAYLGISIARGLTLLPSTPLVIAGTMIFPESPALVLLISIFGIFVSSSMIYFFSDHLGFSEYFERKRPEQIHKIKRQLEKPLGIFFVFIWAFFPFVPTDAICYVAGTSRMTFWKFIIAILLGEFVLCSFYVFSGGYLMHIFR